MGRNNITEGTIVGARSLHTGWMNRAGRKGLERVFSSVMWMDADRWGGHRKKEESKSSFRWEVGACLRVFFQNFSLRAHNGFNLINYMWKCVKMVENQQKFRNVIITELHSQCVCNVSRRLHRSPNKMFHTWDKEKTAEDFCSAGFWFWANKNKYLSCWKLWKMPSLKQICRNQTNAWASPHIL